MDAIEKSDLITTPFYDGTVTTDCADEYTLPDYFPEIRRILSVSARALPESKFVSDGKIEFGGTVVFTVMYVGDSGELAGLPYAFAYSSAAACADPSRPLACVTVDTRVETPQCRVLAPRRISLRARLRSHVMADGQRSVGVPITAGSDKLTPADVISVEKKKEPAFSASRHAVSMTGTVTGIMHESEPMKLISCDGSASVTAVTAKDGAIAASGCAGVSAVCLTGSGKYALCHAEVPFEELIPCEGIAAGMQVRASACCASSGVTIPDGDPTSLRFEVEYDISAEGIGRDECEIVTDVYSTEYEVSAAGTEYDALSPFYCGNTSLSVDGAQDDVGDGYVISRMGDAYCEKVEIDGDRGIISGAAAVRVIIGGDEMRSVDVTMPFKAEVRGTSDAAGCSAIGRYEVTVTDVTARLDGGRLTVTAEIGISCTILASKRIRAIIGCEVEKGKKIPHDDGVIRMYYPAEGDTVWSVAKAYHVPLAEFERVNGDAISGRPVVVG